MTRGSVAGKWAMFEATRLQPSRIRNHAALALHQLFGGRLALLDLPLLVSLFLPDMNLVVTASDQERPIDPQRLRPSALAQSADLIAIYVDAHRRGHDLLLDLLVGGAGRPVSYPAYRLWISEADDMAFLPDAGRGGAVLVAPTGFKTSIRPPYTDALQRTAGIARGQAVLTDLIWGTG